MTGGRGSPSPYDGGDPPPGVCPRYHRAVELVGRRWTGAILAVLLERGPQRFGELGAALPALSDRVLSARMKELEAHGVVAREVHPGPPVRVEYGLTEMGRALDEAVGSLRSWALEWLPEPGPADSTTSPAGGPRSPATPSRLTPSARLLDGS